MVLILHNCPTTKNPGWASHSEGRKNEGFFLIWWGERRRIAGLKGAQAHLLKPRSIQFSPQGSLQCIHVRPKYGVHPHSW